MTKRLTLVVALILCVATACADDSGDPEAEQPSATPSTPSTPTATGAPDFISGLFKIPGGRSLYLYCEGTGSPTVLFESGDESGNEDWDLVTPAIAERTQVCRYDRLGTGSSDPATGCRDMDDILGDLFALLKVAEIEGPFVLVGASGGGYLAAEHAMRRPRDTVGLVLVETPAVVPNPPPDLVELLKCDAETNIERRDYLQVEHAAWDHRHRVGDIPLIVISNRYGKDAQNVLERRNVELQRGWFRLSPRSARQVVVTSGHDVPLNEPDVVIDAVLEVLDSAG